MDLRRREEELQPVEEVRRRNVRAFFCGFTWTTLVLLPLFAATFFLAKASFGKELTPAAENAEKIPIGATSSYNLLLMVEDARSGSLCGCAAMRFDVGRKRVFVSAFPENTIMLYSKMPETVAGIFSERGALGVKAAVEETLAIPVSGYVSVTTEELSSMCDKLGSFEYFLAEDITFKSAEGIVTYLKPMGSSKFFGNDVAKAMEYDGFGDVDRLTVQSGLLCAALGQYCDESFSDKLLNIYSELSGKASTSLRATDAHTLSLAVETVCRSEDVFVEAVGLEGAFGDNGFLLGPTAPDKLGVVFSKLH